MAVLTVSAPWGGGGPWRVGWAWRIAAQNQPMAPPGREWCCATPTATRGARLWPRASRGRRARAWNCASRQTDGTTYSLQLAPRPRPGATVAPGPQPPSPPGGGPDAAFWTRPPFGFVWMLGWWAWPWPWGCFPSSAACCSGWKPAAQRATLWRGRPVGARARAGAGRGGRPGAPVQRAAARIEALVKSHKSLLANASHELRSPLTRIRMGLELMGGRPAFAHFARRNPAQHRRAGPAGG
jgi:two-component system OmpR family sensor kinase